MKQTITETAVSRKRIRELARAHDRAWTDRAKVLRESKAIVVPIKDLTQRTHAPLLALLAESVPEGRWVAASRSRCMLIEREQDELVLRSVRRKAVESAPLQAEAKTVVRQSSAERGRRYHEAIVTVRGISGWICVLALGLFAVGLAVGFAEGYEGALRTAVWSLIAAMAALVVYILARVSVSEQLEEMAPGFYGDDCEEANE